MSKSVVVIGSGFAGLSAACYLAKDGFQVKLIEKNESAGGRASVFSREGFTFDMGPSWYWMPDVFEQFFADFGYSVQDYYQLIRLDPAYRIFFQEGEPVDIPADMQELKALFESWEPGAADQLEKYLAKAGELYRISMGELVQKPSLSYAEFAKWSIVKHLGKLNLTKSVRSLIHAQFQDDRIRKILEFPAYFLGALPEETPSLYSLMNFADLEMGTWYPMGGMYRIVEAMQRLAQDLGVEFCFNQSAEEILVKNNLGTSVKTIKTQFDADVIVAGADYRFVEQQLLSKTHRNYDESYWSKRVMAPSALIYYCGIDKKLDALEHHNLFFDASFEEFGQDIYKTEKWPDNPLFYACCPSRTDGSVAPEGKENLFILIPVAPGLTDSEELREHYFDLIIERIEKKIGTSFKNDILFKESFAPTDFTKRYNAYKGNAYGLANTLSQTAVFKPKIRNKKVKNLWYTGQLTVPGPGVPPSLISGKIVAGEISKQTA